MTIIQKLEGDNPVSVYLFFTLGSERDELLLISDIPSNWIQKVNTQLISQNEFYGQNSQVITGPFFSI